MLKITKEELEKISYANMHLFIEKGMRGGISYINKRFSKTNHEYYPDYDRTKPENFITYLDINNLYGQVMSEYLPYGGFKWVKVNNETINKVLNKIEVDLEVPEELHDYPMAPVKIKIEDDMLSPYCSEIKRKYDIKSGGINKLYQI